MSKAKGLTLSLPVQIHACGLPAPRLELAFHPTRKWRFDICWPEKMLAVECDGGTWIQGRHSRGAGYEKDCEKVAEAMILGWAVLRVTTGQVRSGQALAWVERLLRG